MLATVDSVIATVTKQLPPKFPDHIAQTIFDGMRHIRDKLKP